MANQARQVEVQMSMLQAANELFQGQTGEATLRSGRKVQILPAKFKHIEYITKLFGLFVSGFTDGELFSLIDTVSKQQQANISAGENPYMTSMDTKAMVDKATGNTALVIKLLNSAVAYLPEVIEHFTDLSRTEFEDLDMDEAMIVAFGVFGRNYNFFTQHLLPVIAVFVASQQRKRAAEATEQVPAKPKKAAKAKK